MKIWELLGKLNRINCDNRIYLQFGRQKWFAFDGSYDDINDIELSPIDDRNEGQRGIFIVKDLIKFLKLSPSINNDIFLADLKGKTWSFSGVKYDDDANMILYVKKEDKEA